MLSTPLAHYLHCDFILVNMPHVSTSCSCHCPLPLNPKIYLWVKYSITHILLMLINLRYTASLNWLSPQITHKEQQNQSIWSPCRGALNLWGLLLCKWLNVSTRSKTVDHKLLFVLMPMVCSSRGKYFEGRKGNPKCLWSHKTPGTKLICSQLADRYPSFLYLIWQPSYISQSSLPLLLVFSGQKLKHSTERWCQDQIMTAWLIY